MAEKWLHLTLIGVLILVTTGLPVDYDEGADQDWQDMLDRKLDDYLMKSRLAGATVGILLDDQLVYASGRGYIREHDAQASTIVPVLDMSKLITAVGVLQLVEKGKLRLTDRVFGKQGVLYFIKPEAPNVMDSRLHHITIEHLLQHTAGFDESIGPVFDPMMNAVYVKKGYQVIDIGQEMGAFGVINQDDIIRFMVGRPLPMKPGTKVMRSNFGYAVLGRIIEEITDMYYEDYIRHNILLPAGMWHTRIGPSPSETYQRRIYKDAAPFLNEDELKTGYIPLANGGTSSVFDAVPPQVLDSTLGWHSNVYDMARFYTALFKKGNEGLIKPETAEILFLPASLNQQLTMDDNVYDGITFTIQTDGTFWHLSDNLDIGITSLVYHKPSDMDFAQVFGEASNFRSNDLTFFFFGIPALESDYLKELIDGMLNLDILPSIAHNGYKEELSQIELSYGDQERMIMYSLPEHRLIGYSNAMRLAGYYPSWLHGYRYDGHSLVVTIFKKATKALELEFDVSVHGNKMKAISHIGQNLEKGYHLTQLQSYHSMAHEGNLAHICLMTKTSTYQAVEFDIDSDLESYFETLDDGIADGYVPVVQSIGVMHQEERASYIMTRVDPNIELDQGQTFMAYHDLTLTQLEDLLKSDALSGHHMVYLDTHVMDHESRFSALFHAGSHGSWLFQADVPEYDLEDVTAKYEALGFFPRLFVAYVHQAEPQYAIYWLSAASEGN